VWSLYKDAQQLGIYDLVCLVDDEALRSERVEPGATGRACGRYPDFRGRDNFSLALADHRRTDPRNVRDTLPVHLSDDANESTSLTLASAIKSRTRWLQVRFKCAVMKQGSAASSAMHIDFPAPDGPG
jgi:hypothetical protein